MIFADSILTGTLNSDCKIPCSQTVAEVFDGAQSENMEDNEVWIAVVNEMEVTSITVDQFSFMESLNFLGSNLGLWPGMGLFQMIEGAVLILLGMKISRIIKISKK